MKYDDLETIWQTSLFPCGEKNSAFWHIDIEVLGENTSNEWCESVAEKEYNNLL